MFLVSSYRSAPVLLVIFLICSKTASALEIDPGIGGGVLYTDNARLTGDDEIDDTILVGYAGARLKEDSGPWNVDVSADVIHLNYTNDTFSDQTYPGLRATARWAQIKGRLDWLMQNYLTQTRVDSLNGATPANIQNTNAFTLGPTITVPITGRQTLVVSPQFQDYRYEDLGTDNQQYTLGADWQYQLRRTTGIGFNSTVTKVDFEENDQATDYISTDLHFGVSGQGSRSSYDLNLGGTNVNRDGASNTGGFTGDFSWLHELTGRSTVLAYMATEYTNTGQLFLSSQTDPDKGGFTNVQTADEVVRNSILRITYRREDAVINSLAWGEFRNIDYKEGVGDRDSGEIGVDFDYNVSPSITTGMFGTLARIKENDFEREDTRYSITGRVGYNLSRKLAANFDLRFQNQDSDSGSLNEYREFSAFIRLVYGFAQVARPQ